MGNMRFKIRLFSIASLSFGSGMNLVALQFGLWFGWVPVGIGIVAFIFSTFPDRFIIKENEENLIPLIYIYNQAKSHGMDFVGRNHSLMKFNNAIIQCGIDGKIDFWGRADRDAVKARKINEPLRRIAPGHWNDYKIDWFTNPDLSTKNTDVFGIPDNNLLFRSFSCIRPGTVGYSNLHANRIQAMRWLSSNDVSNYGTLHESSRIQHIPDLPCQCCRAERLR
jgi:hypothetical protein